MVYLKQRQIVSLLAMKTGNGVEVQLHSFLTSALLGGEWSASRTSRFTSGESHQCVPEPNLFPLPGIEPQLVRLPARSIT
jgi:hypothetical protein